MTYRTSGAAYRPNYNGPTNW